MDINKEEWVVVVTAGGKFIGKVDESGTDDFDEKFMVLKPAFDLITPMQQVPGPDGTMGITKAAIVTPIDITNQPVRFAVVPIGVIRFKDMEESDVERYKKLVKHALETAQAARLSELGLTSVRSPLVVPPH